MLNPKAVLSFHSFLPQVMDPKWTSVPAQLVLLGFIFIASCTLVDTGWGRLCRAGWAMDEAPPGRIHLLQARHKVRFVQLGLRFDLFKR